MDMTLTTTNLLADGPQCAVGASRRKVPGAFESVRAVAFAGRRAC
jgi:hypothetical protein